MKAKILIIDNENNQFTGEIILSPLTRRSGQKNGMVETEKDIVPNFEMSMRAFVKKYSKGMGGPKKFVLLLAYLVKGRAEEEKSTKEIRKRWNKMTFLLKNQRKEKGAFNSYYPTTAKDNGWVDSKKYGFYHLAPQWAKIFVKSKK